MLPRKQRHTAKRVHDRLRAETDYDGEYTTTLRYVRRWRETNRSGSDGYGELVWASGVAQIDFGVAKARIASELVDGHCLVVTFPHSNMRYAASLPGENAECLCHGPVEVFEHIGGVPPAIVMDNATGAGRRNAKGEVTPAAVFDAFLAHHRIDARFCNPYSGWEKGSVENAVGFLRRNLMVPPMEAETHEQLTRLMLAKCDELGKSIHYRTLDPIDMMFADDVKSLHPLPSRRFDAVRWETRKVDKYGCADIDGNRYQIGANMHGRRVDVAIRAAKVRRQGRSGACHRRTRTRLWQIGAHDPGPGHRVPAARGQARRVARLLHLSRHTRPGEGPARPGRRRTLKSSLKAIAKACEAAGFEPAMQAMQHFISHGWDFTSDDLGMLARRFADSDIDYGADLPALDAYDQFNHPGKDES